MGRRAFRAVGCDAWSCDLLPAEDGSPYHIQGDVLGVLDQGWDLLVGHPPCQHLSSSGARWWAEKQADGRQQQGIDFFMALANAPIDRVCLENPVGIMSTKWQRPTQIVQPYFWGDKATKTTCLWLKNLPKLVATDMVDKGERHVTKSGRSLPKWYNLPPSPDRWKIRSTTFSGIAKAMADQWGQL